MPSALQALADEGGRGRPPHEILAARIERDGLDDEHLEGLGLFGAPEEDEDGDPAPPSWDAVLPAMVDDCLDQLRQLKLLDNKDRITRDGRRCMTDVRHLQRAVRHEYKIPGADGTPRPVVGQLMATFAAFPRLGKERDEDPFSAIYRPALCLAEFMQLHFWMEKLEKAPGSRQFARMLTKDRAQDLVGMEVEGDTIGWAAYCIATGAGRRLEAKCGERAEERIAAVKSTALMLCDAGILTLDGFPGELQWLRPADKRAVERRQRRTS